MLTVSRAVIRPFISLTSLVGIGFHSVPELVKNRIVISRTAR